MGFLMKTYLSLGGLTLIGLCMNGCLMVPLADNRFDEKLIGQLVEQKSNKQTILTRVGRPFAQTSDKRIWIFQDIDSAAGVFGQKGGAKLNDIHLYL